MFRIKICGVRTAAEVDCVCAAGADAIGLNFYPASRRYVSPAAAIGLAHRAEGLSRVALFVNASVAEIRETWDAVPCDYVQLHGDESPELLAQLPGIPLIKAFRCRGGDLTPVYAYLDRCDRLGLRLAGVLVDAYEPHSYGGTGRALDWHGLVDALRPEPQLKLILAGGLTPDNVRSAILTVRPLAVDTASGVEAAEGSGKDPELVRQFVAAARSAFAEL